MENKLTSAEPGNVTIISEFLQTVDLITDFAISDKEKIKMIESEVQKEYYRVGVTPKSISDSPSAEDVKRWFQLLVGKGEEAMREDMEASLKPNKLTESANKELFEKFECDQCDGCGWYEGGEALKTNCGTCDGKGYIFKPITQNGEYGWL